MTGWRIGWICGNKEAIKHFAKLKSTIDNGVMKPMQKASAEILNSKEGEEYIKECNKMFRKRQQILVEGLKKLGWKDFHVPDTTFYLWLPIPRRYDSSVQRLFQKPKHNQHHCKREPNNSFSSTLLFGRNFFQENPNEKDRSDHSQSKGNIPQGKEYTSNKIISARAR